MDQHKRDRAMTVVFNQLEMLQELAVGVGDSDLANDLSAAFAGALTRYCDHKRTELGAELNKPPCAIDLVRQTPSTAHGAVV